MKEYTSKRAQETQAKRTAAKDDEIRDCMDNLERASFFIEHNLSKFREMIRQRKKKNEYGDTLDSRKDAVIRELSELEDYIARLLSLDKNNSLISHYQQKVDKWQSELTDLEKQMEELKNVSLFSLFGKKTTKAKETKEVVHSKTPQAEEQNINLFSNNAEQVKEVLTQLTITVDSKIKSFCSGNKHVKSDIAKFGSGLAILKSIDPNNSIISHFESKQQEWSMKIERAKKSKILVIVGVIILLILSDYI
ncbi:hypothetical protein [Parabacteroides sp.]